jgi:acetate kinase
VLKLGGLGKVDAIVFTGGIGEKSKELREAVGRFVEDAWGVGVDRSLNGCVGEKEGTVVDVSGADADVCKGRTTRMLVVRTDEQVRYVGGFADDKCSCVFLSMRWRDNLWMRKAEILRGLLQ